MTSSVPTVAEVVRARQPSKTGSKPRFTVNYSLLTCYSALRLIFTLTEFSWQIYDISAVLYKQLRRKRKPAMAHLTANKAEILRFYTKISSTRYPPSFFSLKHEESKRRRHQKRHIKEQPVICQPCVGIHLHFLNVLTGCFL